MGGQHAVKHGEQSWFEAQQDQPYRDELNSARAPWLNLPVAAPRGLAEAAHVDLPDGHPSSPSYLRPRPRPRVLTVVQFVAKMRTKHQVRWGRVCECGAMDCVYQYAVTGLDPTDTDRVVRFLRWLSAAHQRVLSGCSCDVPGCEIRQDLDCVDGMTVASAARGGWSS